MTRELLDQIHSYLAEEHPELAQNKPSTDQLKKAIKLATKLRRVRAPDGPSALGRPFDREGPMTRQSGAGWLGSTRTLRTGFRPHDDRAVQGPCVDVEGIRWC